MTALEWDRVGDRRFETGVDRGVLFLHDGRAVPWNGLTAVEDSTAFESTSHYLDGVKYLERLIPGDFAGSLSAMTYPEEFNEVLGNKPVHPGLYYHDQRPKMFNLCYRTLIGNDAEELRHGYRLHLLYNVVASPAARAYRSVGEQVEGGEFTWALSSTPPIPTGHLPTTHISIDSTETTPERMAALERLLYGTETSDPRMPYPDEFAQLFEMYNSLVIVDNGDGTWTASDLTDSYIDMLDEETFEISNADATFIDADTYTISTTTP